MLKRAIDKGPALAAGFVVRPFQGDHPALHAGGEPHAVDRCGGEGNRTLAAGNDPSANSAVTGALGHHVEPDDPCRAAAYIRDREFQLFLAIVADVAVVILQHRLRLRPDPAGILLLG